MSCNSNFMNKFKRRSNTEFSWFMRLSYWAWLKPSSCFYSSNGRWKKTMWFCESIDLMLLNQAQASQQYCHFNDDNYLLFHDHPKNKKTSYKEEWIKGIHHVLARHRHCFNRSLHCVWTFNIFPWVCENVMSKELTFSPRNSISWTEFKWCFSNLEWTPDIEKESLHWTWTLNLPL